MGITLDLTPEKNLINRNKLDLSHNKFDLKLQIIVFFQPIQATQNWIWQRP